MSEFVMPKLGADMTAGTIIRWHKGPGEFIKRGDTIASVETDKGVIDVESFSTGTIEKLLVAVGEQAEVGATLAILADQETPPGIAAAPLATAAAEHETAPASTSRADWTKLRISPSARQLARKLAIDPLRVTGTGPKGAITREDIERAAAMIVETVQTPPAPATPKDDAKLRMRQAIAAAMTRSKREIPHYYVSSTIDLHRATTWLTAKNACRALPDRLLLGALFLKAAALALHEVPELNAIWAGDRVERLEAIHVGVAISLRDGGLLAPALRNADQQSLDDVMRQMHDLVNRTRVGGLTSSELMDPTITVTSLGDQGVESVFGIINPPQVAIVGFGKVVERPWSVDGQIVSRPVVTATLSADHRVSDGHRGALYLTAIDRLLQEPETL